MNATFRQRTRRAAGGCLVWTGRRAKDGYARLGGKNAHRLAFELSKGPIPPGLEIDHLCNNRACVEPSHLEAVTREENNRRRLERKTHCKHGHPFDEANTYWLRERRYCRACNRANAANSAARSRIAQTP